MTKKIILAAFPLLFIAVIACDSGNIVGDLSIPPSVEIDKTEYNQGETITFTVKAGNRLIQLPVCGTILYQIETLDNGTWKNIGPLYWACPAYLSPEFILKPGQKAVASARVEGSGTFRLHIPFTSVGKPNALKTQPFTVY